MRSFFLFAFALFAALPLVANASPTVLSHHGRLLSASDQPVNGTHELTFYLYNSASGGTRLWQETWEVGFVDGFYSVLLGTDENDPDGPGTLDPGLFKQSLFLSVRVGNGPELQPRQRLVAAPYAMFAAQAESVGAGAVIDGAVISGATITGSSIQMGDHVIIDSSGNWVAPPEALPYMTRDEVVSLEGDQSIDGVLTAQRFVSTESLLPPFEVNSGALIENLNAERLDGRQAEDFVERSDLAHTSFRNHVRNSSFETLLEPDSPPQSWQSSNAIFAPSTGLYDQNSLFFSTSGNGSLWQDVLNSSQANQLAGRTFSASIWARRVSGEGAANLCLSSGPTETEQSCVSISEAESGNGSAWVRTTLSHTINENPTNLSFNISTDAAAAQWEFDGALVNEGPLAFGWIPHLFEQLGSAGIDGGTLEDGSVDSLALADGSVTTPKLADRAVSGEKIGLGAVGPDQIEPGAVGRAQLEAGAVDGTVLNLNSVDTAHLEDGAVTSPKLAFGAVERLHLAEESVDGDVIAAGSITGSHIEAGTITADKLAPGASGTDSIADGSITFEKLAAGAVRGDRIPSGGIKATHLDAGSVTTSALADESVTSVKIGSAQVGADHLAANSVTNAKIATGAVGTPEIQDDAISTAKLKDLHVTRAKIDNLAINSGKLANSAVTEAKLASNAVSTAKIADGAVTTFKIRSRTITADRIALQAVGEQELAEGAVVSSKLGLGAVDETKLANQSVSSDKIKDGAVTSSKFGSGSVSSSHIQPAAVTTEKLADSAVNAGKIADSAVTGIKLAANAVSTAKIGDNQVTGAKIADGAISANKIDSGAISSAKIADGAVGNSKLANNAVTGAKIQDSTITGAKLVDQTIGGDKLTTNLITNSHIANAAISGTKLTAGTVAGDRLADKTVSGGKIADGAVNSVKLADLAVTTAKINTTAVTADKIASNAVTEVKLASNSVSNAKIADSAISTEKLQNLSVTGAKIASGTITNTHIANNTITAAKLLQGSGSGIDADTVDGLHASAFLRSNANTGTSGRLGAGTTSPGTQLHVYTGTTDESSFPTLTSFGDTQFRIDAGNDGIEIGAGRKTNERKAWILARHNSLAEYGMHFSTLHLQPHLGSGTVYKGVAIGHTPNTISDYQLSVAGIIRYQQLSQFSDARYKTVHGPYERGLDDLKGVKTHRFNFIENNPLSLDSSKEHQGVLAQELMTHIPEAVELGSDGVYVVQSEVVLWTLVNAIQDQQEIIEGQEADIAALRQEKEDMEQRLRQIEGVLGLAAGSGN